MKNMEPSACLRIQHPVAFFFKEKEVIATHPLSCHPRRVFGSLESERKGDEMREIEKEWEELKASRQKKKFNEEDPQIQFLYGAFIAKPPLQITKITRQTILQWGQNRKKTKK